MAQNLVLADERRRDVLRDHEARVQPAVVREERGQTVGERRVHETLDAPLRDGRELGERHGERVERERERLAVEVPVRHELVLLGDDERVVGGSVQLDRDRALGVAKMSRLAPCTCARSAASTRPAPCRTTVRLDDRRPFEQLEDVGGRGDLARQRAQSVHLRQKAHARGLQRLDRQRARDIGCLREPPGANQRKRADGRHELGPLMSEKPSFACRRIGSRPARASASAPLQLLPVHDRSALAHERKREMREEREITGRADRAAARHDGHDVAVHALEEQLDHFRPRAGNPLPTRSRAGAWRPGRPRADRARRRRKRGFATAGAAAPARARTGWSARRSGRSRY